MFIHYLLSCRLFREAHNILYELGNVKPASWRRDYDLLGGHCMCYWWCTCSTGSVERAGDETVGLSGKYVYMSELRELGACRPAHLPAIPDSVGVVTTPLQLRAWEWELRGHPDREYARFILDGIAHGFLIGYDYSHSCVSASGT